VQRVDQAEEPAALALVGEIEDILGVDVDRADRRASSLEVAECGDRRGNRRAGAMRVRRNDQESGGDDLGKDDDPCKEERETRIEYMPMTRDIAIVKAVTRARKRKRREPWPAARRAIPA